MFAGDLDAFLSNIVNKNATLGNLSDEEHCMFAGEGMSTIPDYLPAITSMTRYACRF
jgi:hypothetical protein